MKNGLESGFCTAKNCRQFVRDGQGEQILIDGEMQRFCDRHRAEFWNPKEFRQNQIAKYAGCSCGCDSCNGPILSDPMTAHCGGPNCR